MTTEHISILPALGLASMLFVIAFTAYQVAHANQGAGHQSRRASMAEAWVNICIGFSINFAANLVLFPLMAGVPISNEANWWGGWIYTSISVLRQFAIRRFFNGRIHTFAVWISRRTA